MKTRLLPIFLVAGLVLGGSLSLKAQVISAGADTSLCPGQNVTLTASLYYAFGPTAPAPTNIPNIMGCDDCLSSTWIPLGFTFNYYGNNYTQCLVSSNGYITFSGTPGGYSPWSIGFNAPNGATDPNNYIGGPYWDINPATLGTDVIRYKTIGVAPNRTFIVEYLGLAGFGCPASVCFGTQIHLKETSNIIETHVFQYQACTWNNGRGIHGTENNPGTFAHIVPGRNGLNAPWYINTAGFTTPPSAAGPEGRRWTPTSPTNYNISVIPFSPIYMPNTPPAAGSISWSIAGGATIGTGASVNVSPATTTNYVVSIPYSTCTTVLYYRDTVQVGMGSLPITTSPNQTICFGESATIFANSILPGVTYSWAPSATLTTPLADTSIATPTTTTTYTVSASNGGCTATATVSVNVNPLPIPTVNPVNPQICEGSSVVMTAGGGTNYMWTPATGLSSTNTATTTASPTTTTAYTIVVTDANGCVDSIVNTVNFFNNPTVTANAATPGVCFSFSDQLTANGAVNYQWSPAAGLNATNIFNPVATPNATTNYQVIGTDANGCRDTAFVQVLVYPNPVAAFSAPVTSSCQPLSVNLQDNSNITSGSVVGWNWTVESNGASTQQNPSFTFPGIGDFDVTLVATSDMGCTDTLTMVDYLHSYSVPTAGFYATPNPATVGDALILFTNTSTADVVSSLWDMDGLAMINAMNPEYEFITADTFMITLIVSTIHGCLDTVSSPVVVEDVSEIWLPNSFTPNLDGLNDVWFPIGRNLLTGATSIDVEIFDKWGMSVYQSTDANKPWDGTFEGTATDCPQDVYVYRVYFVNEKGKEFNYSGHINLIR